MTTSPVLTERHLDALGADSVENLARLAFRAAHREHPQYDGFLDDPAQGHVRVVRITRDPAPAAGTFSRFQPGDVVLAWTPRQPLPGFAQTTTAYCPRVGWNVALIPGCWEEV